MNWKVSSCLVLGIASVLLLFPACGNEEVLGKENPQNTILSTLHSDLDLIVTTEPIKQTTYPLGMRTDTEGSESVVLSSESSNLSTGGGIHVTGRSSVTMEPNLALLEIEIEAVGLTVSSARRQAAEAMIVTEGALHDFGLKIEDVKTRHFNISPRYEYQEFDMEGARIGKQVLTGYVVNNSITVKIRNMKDIGDIIDGVSDAGGETVRINGVRFTVENTEPYMVGLRKLAVENAVSKAQQLAELAGVRLGQIQSISESSGPDYVRNYPEPSFGARAMAMPSTPISPGELEISLSIHVSFDIQ